MPLSMPAEWIWLIVTLAHAAERTPPAEPAPDAALLEFLAEWETPQGRALDPMDFQTEPDQAGATSPQPELAPAAPKP